MQAVGSRAGLAGIPSAFEIRMIPSRAPTARQRTTEFDMILLNFSIASCSILIPPLWMVWLFCVRSLLVTDMQLFLF